MFAPLTHPLLLPASHRSYKPTMFAPGKHLYADIDGHKQLQM